MISAYNIEGLKYVLEILEKQQIFEYCRHMKPCNCVTQPDTRRVRGIYTTLYQIKTKILLTPMFFL